MADPIDQEMEKRQDIKFTPSYDFKAPSKTHCIECDEPIPEARQRLGGVTRCAECQEWEDKRR